MELFSMDDALGRLVSLVGKVLDWSTLSSFLPFGIKDDLVRRSAVASTFAASLELVRSGQAEIRQDQLFGPIFFRSRDGERVRGVATSALANNRPDLREVSNDDDS
jgi:segregation and condensation protein A